MLERVKLRSPAVVGREVALEVDAVDALAPVSGMVAQFGNRRSVFGTSACQAADSSGLLPTGPFAPGARVRLTGLHKFRRKGRRRVVVRVDSGGCVLPLSSIFQSLTVTPTDPGKRPLPIVPSLPTATPPGGGEGLPLLVPRAVARRADGAPLLSRGTTALASPRAAARGCPGGGRRPGRSADSLRLARRALLCMLNAQRRRHGLPGLRASGRLRAAAESHSRSMIARNFFSHIGPGGIGPVNRVLPTGYLQDARIWSVGENIGFGTGSISTPRYMVRGWMRSTPHRHNILAGKYREIGLG